MVPELEEGELEKVMNPIIQEYFEHGDTKEVEVRCAHTQLHVGGGVKPLEGAVLYFVERLMHSEMGCVEQE